MLFFVYTKLVLNVNSNYLKTKPFKNLIIVKTVANFFYESNL